jgi:hypothetical protein
MKKSVVFFQSFEAVINNIAHQWERTENYFQTIINI